MRNRTFFFADYEGFRQISKDLTFASIPTLEQRQGILGRPISNPLTGEVYANGVIPASAITPFARQVLAGLPEPTRPGIAEQLRFAAPPRGLQRQVRRQGRSPVQHADDGVRALQPPQARTTSSRRRFRARPAVRANAFVHVLNQQFAGGFTFTVTPTSLLEVRLGVSRTEGRQGASRRRRADDARAVRHYGAADRSAVRRRADRAGRHRMDDVGAAEQQSAVPGSVGHQSRASTSRGSAAVRASRPATSTRRSTRRSTTSTRSTAATPTAASSAGRPRAAADPATYNLADFMFGARNSLRDHQSVHRQPAPADALRLHAGRLSGRLESLTLNLGLRYEFATPQWEKPTTSSPTSIRDANTLIQAKDGSIYDRALVNPDRNNFAPRLGARLVDRRQDGRAQRLRHQLHPLQPAGRREPALLQRPARRRPQHHAAAVAGSVHREHAADHLLPDDAAGVSGGARTFRRISAR